MISSYNLENPIFRDVFTVPKNGWAAIRFIADNPGKMSFDCTQISLPGKRISVALLFNCKSIAPQTLSLLLYKQLKFVCLTSAASLI